MKKIFLAIAVLGLISTTACSKKDAGDAAANADSTENAANDQVNDVLIDEESYTTTDTIPVNDSVSAIVETTTDVAAATDLN